MATFDAIAGAGAAIGADNAGAFSAVIAF